MQTFMAFADFEKSAKVLDNRRLGKMRLEAFQILCAITNPDYGWQSHPAVRMWRGYEASLANYGIAICNEWIARGFQDTMLPRIVTFKHNFSQNLGQNPPWLGDEKFHASHRSNLLRKDPNWYGQFGWQEPMDLPYVWPNNK